MALKNFIKENFVLVAGLALPVLLVVLFLLFSIVPRSMAAPPQYEVLFADRYHGPQNRNAPYDAHFFVKEGILMARVWKTQDTYSRTRLMAFDGKTLREIPYDIGNVPDRAEIALDGFKGMKLDDSAIAPDGYVFESGRHGSHGLVTEFFGAGYHDAAPRLTKGAVSYSVPGNENYYYGNIQFIGWIIQK
jgi:hypothetical protein